MTEEEEHDFYSTQDKHIGVPMMPIGPDRTPEALLKTPERNLLWAMLARAIRDYYNKGDSVLAKRYRRQAEKWFFENRPSHTKRIFSFVYVCYHLNLPVEKTRERLRFYKNNWEELAKIDFDGRQFHSYPRIRWPRMELGTSG